MIGVPPGSQQHRESIPGQHRHIDVKQNEIGLELTHEVHYPVPLALGNYLESFIFKQCLRDIEKHFIIVNYQDSLFDSHGYALFNEPFTVFYACNLRYWLTLLRKSVILPLQIYPRTPWVFTSSLKLSSSLDEWKTIGVVIASQ